MDPTLRAIVSGIIFVFVLLNHALAEYRSDNIPTPLPKIRIHLPMFDFLQHPKTEHEGATILSPLDSTLRNHFPGQFFTDQEIAAIGQGFEESMRRKRREVDRDVCCRTKVWFGMAPSELTDAKDDKKWQILKGSKMFQAYSRGECHSSAPQPECPRGGMCRQKLRMHTLWVADGAAGELRYFNIPSHCAYEKG